MNRSYSKIRHIKDSNLVLEQRFLSEQPLATPQNQKYPLSPLGSNALSLVKKTPEVQALPMFLKTYKDMVDRQSKRDASTKNDTGSYRPEQESTRVSQIKVEAPPVEEQQKTFDQLIYDIKEQMSSAAGMITTGIINIFGGGIITESVYALLLTYDLTKPTIIWYDIIYDILGLLSGGTLIGKFGGILKTIYSEVGNNFALIINKLSRYIPNIIALLQKVLGFTATIINGVSTLVTSLIQNFPSLKSVGELIIKGSNSVATFLGELIQAIAPNATGKIVAQLAQKTVEKEVKSRVQEPIKAQFK